MLAINFEFSELKLKKTGFYPQNDLFDHIICIEKNVKHGFSVLVLFKLSKNVGVSSSPKNSNERQIMDTRNLTTRTWAEISIASDRDSAQKGRGVPLVQSRTEGDFPTTPWPMRVEIASDGDFLPLDKKDIKERQAGEVGHLGGRGSCCWLVRLVLGHRL